MPSKTTEINLASQQSEDSHLRVVNNLQGEQGFYIFIVSYLLCMACSEYYILFSDSISFDHIINHHNYIERVLYIIIELWCVLFFLTSAPILYTLATHLYSF